MRPVIVPAYAKLNLTLDVTGVRPDGYHEIASVMQTVSLHDLLLVERSDCRIFEMSGTAIAGENLVLRAARELEASVGQALPFRIRLHKRIPVGAGLGGGSADAAAFLRVAPRLYGLTVPADQLEAIAVAIGQDVPFLLRGGTALATGLGSTVERLPPLDPSWTVVVVFAGVEVSTRAVYEAVPVASPGGARTAAVAAGLRAGRVPDPDALGNDLEGVTAGCYPAVSRAIAPIKAILPGLRMTGSGAAFFAPLRNRAAAAEALAVCRQAGLSAWWCRPVPAWG
jgi:4-diphosphocytidyl-2-C-methyl-D-erythritol kinase